MSDNAVKIEGAAGGTHTYSHAEKRSYCDFINQELSADPDLGGELPMDPKSDQLFTVISKGVLLCKLINKTFENAVNEAKLNKKPKNTYQVNENHDLCIAAAKKIGCSVVNIGGKDLEAGIPHLTMGLLWQIIKRSLMYKIENMDLRRILEANESLANVPPEQILLRWFNCHLRNSGHSRTVTNFSSDLQDAENYAVLLASIAPDKISSKELEAAFNEKDFLKRAEMVLEWADRLGCRKFVTAQDIIDGNPNLNLAFVASLFQKYPQVGPSKEDLSKELEVKLEEVEGLLAESLIEKEGIEARLNKTRLDFDILCEEFNGLKVKLDETTNERDSLKKDKLSLEELLDSSRKNKDSLKDKLAARKAEKDSLLSKISSEKSTVQSLKEELEKTKLAFSEFEEESTRIISGLNENIENELKLKKELELKIEQTTSEIQSIKQNSDKRQSELNEQIENEINLKMQLNAQLASAKKELEETRNRVKEVEQTKEDLLKLLTDTIAELETTKANSQQMEESLRNQINAQIAEREEYTRLLNEKTREFELAMADWSAEREKLLKRIKELQEELASVKAEMRMKLDKAEKDMEDALALSDAELRRLLNEAESEKDQALDKVRLLLAGNQKQGVLYKFEPTLVGKEWKKKFFVLRDNLLCWYSSEKRVAGERPKGVIYCEEARLYELDPKECKRDFAFQITTDKARHDIAADSLEDMKEWMTEIRVAKKKKLGVKVVSDERTK